jgi:hypothetical protein
VRTIAAVLFAQLDNLAVGQAGAVINTEVVEHLLDGLGEGSLHADG